MIMTILVSYNLGSSWVNSLKCEISGTIYVSGKLPTYPSLKPTLILTAHLGQNVGLGEG